MLETAWESRWLPDQQKKLTYAKVVAMPQPHEPFEHRGTECVPPITAGKAVKIYAGFTSGPVSYTHLDVYKRQVWHLLGNP